MEESLIYKHGQVWYWEDPIYGKKSEQLMVDPGEVSQRYSRYVVILQGVITEDDNNIICLPLSSSKHSESDVKVQIMHYSKKTSSYVMINKIFVASTTSLCRYMCTLPDETMKSIREELHTLIAPESVKTAELKRKKSKNKSLIGFKYPNNTKINNEGEMNTGEIVKKDPAARFNRWNNIESKINFIAAYEKYDIDILCKMYNLSEETCMIYYRKFKRDINAKKTKEK